MKAVIRKDANINLRATESFKALVDRAADALGKHRTEFIIEVMSAKAHEVLADQNEFHLGENRMAEFLRLLDAPLSDAARRLLARPAPWA